MSATEIHYKTIQSPSVAEYHDKGSRFIAFAYPISSVEEFKFQLKKLKSEHPKAVHFCFAYRIGTDKNNFRSSDDGEPSGTAGKPILNQIDASQITNVLVVVVRYFGGILLGVPGLINAYKSSSQLVLANSKIITKIVECLIIIDCDYNSLGEIMHYIKQQNYIIEEKKIELFCAIKIRVPVNEIDQMQSKFKLINNVKITVGEIPNHFL